MAIILSAKLAEIKNMAKPGLELTKRRFNARKSSRRHFFLDKKLELALFYFYYTTKGCENKWLKKLLSQFIVKNVAKY